MNSSKFNINFNIKNRNKQDSLKKYANSIYPQPHWSSPASPLHVGHTNARATSAGGNRFDSHVAYYAWETLDGMPGGKCCRTNEKYSKQYPASKKIPCSTLYIK